MKSKFKILRHERCKIMNIKKITLLGVVALGLVMGGCSVKGDEARADVNYLPVKLGDVVKENIEKEYFTIGTVKAENSVVVTPKIAGKVKKIYVEVGEEISKGQLLFEIDGGDTLNKMDLSVKSTQEQLNQSKVTLDDAKKNYDDMKNLYEEGSISESDFIAVKSGYEKAKSAYNSALNSYNSNIESKSNTLSDLKVVSTIDGIVGDIDMTEGQMASQSNYVKIFNDEKYQIEVGITEDAIDKFNVGQEAKIVIPSKDDKEYKGIVTSVSPIASNGNHTFPVEVAIDSGEDLREGMYGEVTFIVESINDQVLVPLDSIIQKGDEFYVYKYEEEQAVKIPVEKGIIEDEMVQIFSDLNESDKIIVKGQNYINDNSILKVVD